jgi:ABC-type transporter Mla subunit MlaD
VGGGGYVVILNIGTPGNPLLSEEPIRGLPPQSLSAVFGSLSRRVLAEGGLLDQAEDMVNPELEGSLMNRILASLTDINAMTTTLRFELDAREQRTLLAKIHLIIDDLNATSTALRGQLDPVDRATLMAKLHSGLEQLATGLSETTQLIQENRPAIRNTLASLEHATRTIDDEVVGGLARELRPDDTTSLLGKIHAGMDRLNTSLEKVVEITETGRHTIALNRPAIDSTIANLKETSDQLLAGVAELRLAPWRLLKEPMPDERQKIAIFEAARSFAQAATHLDDAAARLEAAVAAAPKGARVTGSDQEIQAIRDSLQLAFERFQKAEQYLFERLR